MLHHVCRPEDSTFYSSNPLLWSYINPIKIYLCHRKIIRYCHSMSSDIRRKAKSLSECRINQGSWHNTITPDNKVAGPYRPPSPQEASRLILYLSTGLLLLPPIGHPAGGDWDERHQTREHHPTVQNLELLLLYLNIRRKYVRII